MLRGGDSLRRRLPFFGILTGILLVCLFISLISIKQHSAEKTKQEVIVENVEEENNSSQRGEWIQKALGVLSMKFYHGVISFYVPGIVSAQDEGTPKAYHDLTAAVYPSIACNEEKLWYESQDGELTDCGNLVAEENQKAKQLLEENQKAHETIAEGTDADRKKETKQEKKDGKSRQNQGNSAVTGDGSITGKKVTINRKKLEDFDYLRQTFYQVDNTTTIGSKQLNVKKLLGPDMKINTEVDGPQILIYHTHSQEGYKDSKAGDPKTSVVGVGDYLTKLLEQKGFSVLHHKGEYDVGDRDHAYSNAAPAIEKLLKKNPGIQVVIDLHRDGVNEKTRLVTEQNGKKMAKIMFFNGLSRTTATGDIPYLKNPYIEDNLALSFQMQLAAAEYYPDLTRKIYLKGYRFNMHFCPKSMLVEVGAQTNTFEEAKNSMEPLADLLDKVLKPETDD